VVRLSALPQEICLVRGWVDLRAIVKNSNDTLWNRTRNLPVCSAVPQPTAPPRSLVLSVFNITC
jgi:hypothetical protein